MRTSCICFLILLGQAPVSAQTLSPREISVDPIAIAISDSTVVVSISSSPSGVAVYRGSHPVGTTPMRSVVRTPDTLIIRLFSPDVNHWMRIVKRDTIRVVHGNAIERYYDFDTMIVIASVPSGADVVLGTRLIGTTPLAYQVRLPLDGRMVLHKIGYEKSVITDPSHVSPANPIHLQPLELDFNGKHSDLVLNGVDEGGANGGLVYTVAGTMMVSGVLAAYLKETGNRKFEEYLRTSDPALLRSTRRYDKAAGVAVAITQVSLALLSYLILSE